MVILFFLIALLSGLLQLWLPWWSMMLVAAGMSFLLGKTFWQTFLAGFLACGLVWLIYAIMIAITHGSLMTDRIASLFSLPASWLLYLVSFLIAAIGGGLGAWMGYSLKRR